MFFLKKVSSPCSGLLVSSSHCLGLPCLTAGDGRASAQGFAGPAPSCEPTSRSVGALGPHQVLWKTGVTRKIVQNPQASSRAPGVNGSHPMDLSGHVSLGWYSSVGKTAPSPYSLNGNPVPKQGQEKYIDISCNLFSHTADGVF